MDQRSPNPEPEQDVRRPERIEPTQRQRRELGELRADQSRDEVAIDAKLVGVKAVGHLRTSPPLDGSVERRSSRGQQLRAYRLDDVPML